MPDFSDLRVGGVPKMSKKGYFQPKMAIFSYIWGKGDFHLGERKNRRILDREEGVPPAPSPRLLHVWFYSILN
jgi:hypothetical protein